jgi:hypothetical protein
VSAKITLGGGMGSRIEIYRLVRAGFHTGFAAYTSLFIKIYNAIRTFVKGARGADGYAGGILAVIAALYQKVLTGVGVTAFLNCFYPGTENTQWYFVLTFTGGGAGVTTDTFSLVYHKAVLHIEPTF